MHAASPNRKSSTSINKNTRKQVQLMLLLQSAKLETGYKCVFCFDHSMGLMWITEGNSPWCQMPTWPIEIALCVKAEQKLYEITWEKVLGL